jgi:hypothetical protein
MFFRKPDYVFLHFDMERVLFVLTQFKYRHIPNYKSLLSYVHVVTVL